MGTAAWWGSSASWAQEFEPNETLLVCLSPMAVESTHNFRTLPPFYMREKLKYPNERYTRKRDLSGFLLQSPEALCLWKVRLVSPLLKLTNPDRH